MFTGLTFEFVCGGVVFIVLTDVGGGGGGTLNVGGTALVAVQIKGLKKENYHLLSWLSHVVDEFVYPVVAAADTDD